MARVKRQFSNFDIFLHRVTITKSVFHQLFASARLISVVYDSDLIYK